MGWLVGIHGSLDVMFVTSRSVVGERGERDWGWEEGGRERDDGGEWRERRDKK